jgi:hypothetical protein
MSKLKSLLALVCLAAPATVLADGQGANLCRSLPDQTALKAALEAAVAA